MIAGAAVFAVPYLSGVLLGLAHQHRSLLVPFAGPIIWLFTEYDEARFGREMLGIMIPLSLVQVLGATLFGLGLWKRRYIQYADSQRRFMVSPSFAPGYAGVNVTVF